jgi:ethanolamine utilization cobalamin adenosyltransferase
MQDVITKEKVAALPDHAELRVMAGAIITQAARELIKEKRISLLFDEQECQMLPPGFSHM